MEEFLNNLYSYEYFGFYLIVSIIVLVILFLIILFFGKKDQKEREIEATKKLQQINSEAFKEENTEEKVEVNNINQEKLENDTIIVPNIEDVPSFNSVEENNEIPEPIIPVETELEAPISLEEIKVEEPKVIEEEKPLLEKVEEKPLVFDNTNIFKEDFIEKVVEEEPKVVEETTTVLEEVAVPEFNFDEIVKDVEEVKLSDTKIQGPQIFSSVYVPEKEEIEIPKVEIEVPTSNELDFELPVLKKDNEEPKEEKIEVPVLNDYNLDELAGETYEIK